jgi:dynein heavy chain
MNMTGNIVLAAGYVSYLGCYTAKYRLELLQNWQKFLNTNNIKNDLNFTVRQTLGNPISIRDWNIKGLPKDDLSIENGIISTNATRWPLLIDP